MAGPRTRVDRVTVRIASHKLLAGGVVDLLAERRQEVAPLVAVVGRPIDAALVEADAAVVLTGNEVCGSAGL